MFALKLRNHAETEATMRDLLAFSNIQGNYVSRAGSDLAHGV
jgi:hypothetical protein